MEKLKKMQQIPVSRKYEAPGIETLEVKIEEGIASSDIYYLDAPNWEDGSTF